MTKSNFAKFASQLAIVGFISYSAPSAYAQSFDMSTVSSGGGNGMESMAATGNYGRRGFKTGQAPGESRLYGHETGFTKKGLGSMTTGLGHLTLPYAASAGMSPVFGFGRQVIMPPTFTSPLDDAITTIGSNSSFSVVPSTGQVYSRIGNVRTGIGFDGNGNASVKIDNGNGLGTTVSNGQVNVNSSILGGAAGGSGGSNSGF
ncbi:MAG: hypothetical protein WCT03_17615 [Candidatus Obscuribacterales bacterium]|jgi:hypothetical protein